jgi:hypothetical protein
MLGTMVTAAGLAPASAQAPAPGATAGPAVPTYAVRRAVDAVTVDGRLDEMTWALSPRVGPLRLITDVHRPPTFPTEAAMAWDDQHLYVSFACTDAAPWARPHQRDDALWNEEVVEVFLDPDGDGTSYAEIEVNPDNVVVDLLIARPRASGPNARAWNAAGMKTAVQRHGAGWTVEIAIPWASLADAGVSAPPSAGQRWRVGLYRIKRPGGVAKSDKVRAMRDEARTAAADRKAALDKEMQALQADDEYAAWSPTRDGSFHDPERFGIVEFVGGPGGVR